MGRSPCCGEDGIKKGPWTSEEDDKLRDYIKVHGRGSWKEIPRLAGLNRCSKSCRLRWTNYLRPDIKRGKFNEDEEEKIIQLHAEMGNKWSAIASKLAGRTDNEIKNHWNTHLRKKLMKKGIDPVTHKPRAEFTLMAALSAGLHAGNGTNSVGLDPHKLQAELAQWARVQLADSILQVLTAAAPGMNGPVAAATTPYSINASGAIFHELPQLEGASARKDSSVIHSYVSPKTAAECSLSSINHNMTSTATIPMRHHPHAFCPSSGSPHSQNPYSSGVIEAIAYNRASSGVRAAVKSTPLGPHQMDAQDALVTVPDITNVDTCAKTSDASVSVALPDDDGFGNYDYLDGIVLQDISSWPPTGFLSEALQNLEAEIQEEDRIGLMRSQS